jgi:glycine betaine/proline transport system ATP-binding protein
MDEPFSALDPLTRREMQDELLRLQKILHRTMVFVSHDTNEALKLGDRIAVLQQGEIVQLGTPEDLLHRPVNDYIRDFMQDVNRSRVLKAGMIARPAISLSLDQALDPFTLQAIQRQNSRCIYVLNPDRQPIGFIQPQHLDRVVHLGVESIPQFLQTKFALVNSDSPLEEILHLYQQERALAIVDGAGTLKGSWNPAMSWPV